MFQDWQPLLWCAAPLHARRRIDALRPYLSAQENLSLDRLGLLATVRNDSSLCCQLCSERAGGGVACETAPFLCGSAVDGVRKARTAGGPPFLFLSENGAKGFMSKRLDMYPRFFRPIWKIHSKCHVG